MSVVNLANVTKSFANIPVLNGLDLHLDKGQVLGLFGHNGAGKTTIMKLILGLTRADAGEVSIFGQSHFDGNFNKLRYKFGFLPENISFYQQLTGKEVLYFFAKLKKIPTSRCVELLRQVGLESAGSRKVKIYSKGMKQRLGLAQALLTEPSLLLLDEPTTGLDPIAVQKFYTIVDELCQKGCSIILCSHILSGVEKHIDKVAILAQGKLCAYGSIDELRKETCLKTIVTFKGSVDIEKINHSLGLYVKTQEDGLFVIDVHAKEKLDCLKTIINQPGITDLNIQPPGLEQLYKFFNDNTQQQTR